MEQLIQTNHHEYNASLTEITESFIGDFIQEILETLDAIELGLVNLEVDPNNAEYLNQVYSNFHVIKGLTGFLEKSTATQITEHTEILLEACRKLNVPTSRNIINVLLQTILFLRKMCNHEQLADNVKFQGEVAQHLKNIHQLRDEIMMEAKQPVRSPGNRIGEILVEEGAIEQQDIDDLLKKQQSSVYQQMKFGEIAIREKKVDAGALIKAIRTQKIRNESSEQYIHIPIKRMDEITDIVAQLANIQNDIHHEAVLRFGSNDAFSVESKRVENMAMDIRKILNELCMVTMKQPFQKLTRAVRAMIEDAGLHVVFSTIGENTALSRELADELIIPLAEIVELMLFGFTPVIEKESGKLGNIEVVAYQKDDLIIIEISNNRIHCCHTTDASTKYERIAAKIKKWDGRLEYENLDDDGCRIKITLNP